MSSIFKNLKADHFDGEAKVSQQSGTVASPALYELMRQLARQTYSFSKLVDAAASTVTAETPFHRADGYTKSVTSVKFLPGAALTAHDTTYATLVVRKRDALGADLGVVASVTTKITGGSGDWTALVPVPLTLAGASDAILDLNDGEQLTWEILKASSGVAVPRGTLQVYAD